MLRILLTCSGGMSSSLVVNALLKEAAVRGIEIESKAVGIPEVERELELASWDGILVAPQVRHQLATVKPFADKKSIPILAIKPQAYSPLGGKMLLAHLTEMGLIQA